MESKVTCQEACGAGGNVASDVRFALIVLKKSFFADDWKFSGPLVRLSRCEVRDHMNYRKNDRWASYRFYSALQRQKSPMRYICEIFGAPRFSSFSTQSANSDYPQTQCYGICPKAQRFLRASAKPQIG